MNDNPLDVRETVEQMPHDTSQDENPFDFTPSGSISTLRLTAQDAVGKQARRSSITLFVVAGLQAVFMVFFTLALVQAFLRMREWESYGADPSQLRLPLLVYVSYALGLLLGSFFLALALWARRDPLLATILGLVVFIGANVFDTVLVFGFGLAVLPGGPFLWLERIFVIVLLGDALRASLVYRRIVNKLIVEARPRSHL
jgi:hypothetical protein